MRRKKGGKTGGMDGKGGLMGKTRQRQMGGKKGKKGGGNARNKSGDKGEQTVEARGKSEERRGSGLSPEV